MRESCSEHAYIHFLCSFLKLLTQLYGFKYSFFFSVISGVFFSFFFHQNYYIIENGQNTEKSPGDLRLAVTEI